MLKETARWDIEGTIAAPTTVLLLLLLLLQLLLLLLRLLLRRLPRRSPNLIPKPLNPEPLSPKPLNPEHKSRVDWVTTLGPWRPQNHTFKEPPVLRV